MAPVTRPGDMPPISAQICFQVQPFSRLMPSSFSVSSARVVADVMTVSLLAAPLPPPQRRPNGTPKTVDQKCSYCRDRDARGCSRGLHPPRLPPCPLWVISGHRGKLKECPLYPQKRTLVERVGMSAFCQKRTSAGYSTSSSASNWAE